MSSKSASPYFLLSHKGGVAIATVDIQEIRHPTPAQEFGADVFALLERDGEKDILVDLGSLRYMSSTGFAVLLNLARRVEVAGGRLKVCNMHPDVAVGANIIGLGRAVETYADQAEALAAF